ARRTQFSQDYRRRTRHTQHANRDSTALEHRLDELSVAFDVRRVGGEIWQGKQTDKLTKSLFFVGNAIFGHLVLNAGRPLGYHTDHTHCTQYGSDQKTRGVGQAEKRYHRTSAVEPGTLTQRSARPPRHC